MFINTTIKVQLKYMHNYVCYAVKIRQHKKKGGGGNGPGATF